MYVQSERETKTGEMRRWMLAMGMKPIAIHALLKLDESYAHS